jgi:hypothetical protein
MSIVYGKPEPKKCVSCGERNVVVFKEYGRVWHQYTQCRRCRSETCRNSAMKGNKHGRDSNRI